MPTRQRRKNGQRRIKSHSITREANIMSGFPRQHRVKMTFAHNLVINGTASVLDQGSKYRANGAYDPLVAAGGDSPFNYGVWSRLYNHYVVMSSRITFRIGHSGSDTTVTSGIYLADDTAALPYSTPGPLIGARRGTYKVLPHIITSDTYNTHAHYNPKVFYSLVDPQDAANITSVTNSLPSDEAIFIVWAYSTVAFLLEGIVEIEYDVLFKEPKDVPQ